MLNLEILTKEVAVTRIGEIAKSQLLDLRSKLDARDLEMRDDNKDHHLIYRVLGVTSAEGEDIDRLQNHGRFLYTHAGRLLEKVTRLCFESRYPDAKSLKIDNPFGARPKKFEIDCLVGNDAHEIKWRDATTDGDHIIKEHLRAQAVTDAGYRPIRVMFFMPNREQAIRIQSTISTLYRGLGGECHYGQEAWDYVLEMTGIDLFEVLSTVAKKNG